MQQATADTDTDGATELHTLQNKNQKRLQFNCTRRRIGIYSGLFKRQWLVIQRLERPAAIGSGSELWAFSPRNLRSMPTTVPKPPAAS
jgi:hypothetical protein